MIAGLRSAGIPAGYVSGFLRTLPPAGKPRLEGADAMHAWVRVWCGLEAGWIEFDPTNAMMAGPGHISIGHGRDYADISPIVGVLRTSGEHRTTQSVDVVQVE
jgi:transglutaminase-like putative cysteine protease